MKRIAIVLACAVLLLASCASSSESASEPAMIDGRPNWTMIDVSTQDVHFAAGYGKMANQQNSIKRAQAAARDALAEWVSTSVNEIITTYTNDSGSEGNRQAMDAFETLSIQNASAVLSGATQADAWFGDPDGGVWVLMSIPVENVASQFYGAAKEAVDNTPFERNEAAVEANNMMNDAISKYFGLGGAAE